MKIAGVGRRKGKQIKMQKFLMFCFEPVMFYNSNGHSGVINSDLSKSSKVAIKKETLKVDYNSSLICEESFSTRN